MAVTNQWSLFGLDLGRVADKCRLGVNQLLWGDEAGLRNRFYPHTYTTSEGAASLDPYAKLTSTRLPSEEKLPVALIFPSDLTLTKSLHLPLEAEVDLDSAMHFEVASHSPFSSQETCSGWRVISRDDARLHIELVIAARSSLMTFCEEQGVVFGGQEDFCEVWAEADAGLVQIEGFGGQVRDTIYLNLLATQTKKVILCLIAVSLLLLLPGAMLATRAGQLQDVLATTESEAEVATSARNTLVLREDQVRAAREFFANRSLYDRWLNSLAEITPDSVYLTRLGLEGDRLTISGMAVNAAEYQTVLAASGSVVELSAPSAFTRDQRSGLERFTLTMRLAGNQ
jgi:general secretion pathway protein L